MHSGPGGVRDKNIRAPFPFGEFGGQQLPNIPAEEPDITYAVQKGIVPGIPYGFLDAFYSHHFPGPACQKNPDRACPR